MPVMVGYDGSEVSERALQFGAEEASMRGLPLEIIAVWGHRQSIWEWVPVPQSTRP